MRTANPSRRAAIEKRSSLVSRQAWTSSVLLRLVSFTLLDTCTELTRIGKLIALDRMLVKFNLLDPPEKVVIVSSYVTTLNLIQGMCEQRKYPLLRLDGSTPAKQRQELVNNFNRSSKRESFIFLLSAKAGGTGINLIGYELPFSGCSE